MLDARTAEPLHPMSVYQLSLKYDNLNFNVLFHLLAPCVFLPHSAYQVKTDQFHFSGSHAFTQYHSVYTENTSWKHLSKYILKNGVFLVFSF